MRQWTCLYTILINFQIRFFSFLTGLSPGVLLGILGGAVPPGSPNHDPISDQKMSFFTLVFRPLKTILDLALGRNYVIIT